VLEFKGKPVNRKIEIAYGTIEAVQHHGIGTKICRALVELSLKTDTFVKSQHELFLKIISTKIITKNNFVWVGIVNDPDDGNVWEWEYREM
jgi:ribosomal-protein-alanine N-acetyltransferase